MGNPVATTARPTGNQWLIESDDHRAVVVEVGGGIRMYQYKGQDYLGGYADNEIAPYTAGQILAPWPNRLRDGEYTFDQRHLTLPLNEPGTYGPVVVL